MIRQFLLLLFLTPLLNSCLSTSDEQVQELKQPDQLIRSTLQVPQYGKIEYQLYKKYGFNETIEQIIEIQRCNSVFQLSQKLPIQTDNIKSLESIDLRKLRENYNINYLPEKDINSDILINGFEYKPKSNIQVCCREGYYQIIKTDNREEIIILDASSRLVYIEIKTIPEN